MVEFLIIYKNHFYPCIVQHKFKIIHSDSWIKWCKNSTDLLNCEIQNDPFRPILTKYRDLITLPGSHVATCDTKFKQTCTQLVNKFLDFLRTVSLPFTIFLAGKHISQWLPIKMILNAIK